MKEILLTQGKVALVDDADFEWLNQWVWSADHKSRQGGMPIWYAVRIDKFRKKHYMHRELTGFRTDHEDGNGLNNQRSNLRRCNQSQNTGNSRLSSRNKSGYKGVRFYLGRWRAQIGTVSGSVHLGSFDSAEDAASAYDEAAKNYFGEFARCNFQ